VGLLPPRVIPKAERVETRSDGSSAGTSARLMRRLSPGASAGEPEYQDIHRRYSAMAESAVKRERIPLSRRDFIRRYFEAIRPQQ